MKSRQLPEFCVSKRKLKPEGIIIHHFSCINVDPDKAFELEACRNLMLDLNRPKVQRQYYMLDDRSNQDRMWASAHIFIGRQGECWKLINFDRQGYHAGVSLLNGREGCNQWTLGIELIGTRESGFTDEQYCALAKLSKAFMKKHDFGDDAIAGHDEVRYGAINNGKRAAFKYDPSGTRNGTGDNFEWPKLYSLLDVF